MLKHECRVHLEEPCGPECSPACDAPWHHRKAVRSHDLCEECLRETAAMDAADRKYAEGYAHACGYHD